VKKKYLLFLLGFTVLLLGVSCENNLQKAILNSGEDICDCDNILSEIDILGSDFEGSVVLDDVEADDDFADEDIDKDAEPDDFEDQDLLRDADSPDIDMVEIEDNSSSISFNYLKTGNIWDVSFTGSLNGYGINQLVEVERGFSFSEYVANVVLRGGFIQHGHQIEVSLRVPFNAQFPYDVEIDDDNNYVRLYAEGLGFLHLRLSTKGIVTVYSLKSPFTEVEELNFKGDNLEVIEN